MTTEFQVVPPGWWVYHGGAYCGIVNPARSGMLFTPSPGLALFAPRINQMVRDDVDNFIALQALTARLLS